MEEIVWWLTNSIFSFCLWLLIDEEGRSVAKIIWSLYIVFLVYLLLKGDWDGKNQKGL